MNCVIVMKMSNLHSTQPKESKDGDSDSDSESDEDNEDNNPVLETAMINHLGSINRIRVSDFYCCVDGFLLDLYTSNLHHFISVNYEFVIGQRTWNSGNFLK